MDETGGGRFDRPQACPHGGACTHEANISAIHDFVAPNLDQIQRDGLVERDCRQCGSRYLGDSSLPLCPICEQQAGYRHIQRLQDRRIALEQELADLRGQIDSMFRRLGRTTYVPRQYVHDTAKCKKCRGWLHLGYYVVNLEQGLVYCQPCGRDMGITEGLQRADFCHHGYPAQMCRPCRALHASRMRDVHRPPAPRSSDKPGVVARVRQRPQPRDLSDVEEI